MGHLLCGLMGSAQFYGVDQPRVLTCRRITRGIRGKYDLKGLEWSPDSRGARPPGLGSAWSELGFARHVSGLLRAGSRRSGGRHTLMLHLFLNSHPAAANPPPPPSRLSGHCFSRARGQSVCEECQERIRARMHRLLSSNQGQPQKKSLAMTTLDEFSGRK